MEPPFRFGGELERDELVDRQEELQQVIETIGTGEKLFLIGPRRYGKTSIFQFELKRLKSGLRNRFLSIRHPQHFSFIFKI